MKELICEACNKAPANDGDILCGDCSHAYIILLDLLRKHPELVKDDLIRLKDVVDWRNKKEQEWLDNIFQRRTSNVPLETTK